MTMSPAMQSAVDDLSAALDDACDSLNVRLEERCIRYLATIDDFADRVHVGTMLFGKRYLKEVDPRTRDGMAPITVDSVSDPGLQSREYVRFHPKH